MGQTTSSRWVTRSSRFKGSKSEELEDLKEPKGSKELDESMEWENSEKVKTSKNSTTLMI